MVGLALEVLRALGGPVEVDPAEPVGSVAEGPGEADSASAPLASRRYLCHG